MNADRLHSFTPLHRGGSGPALVCLHGFMDTWRIWELVLPRLERKHDVLAPTLAGHAGGPPLEGPLSPSPLVDGVERVMDEAGVEAAHIVGNSLGAFIALQLAVRGRARSVVAFAPPGGWADVESSFGELLRFQLELREQVKAALPQAGASLASAEGMRRATRYLTVNYEHIPSEMLIHQMIGVARCEAASAHIDAASREVWSLNAAEITCPVRIVWGTADRLLPWPSAAARYRESWLPHADWVELDNVGHCPQLDVPLETAQLILGFTS